MEFDLLHQLVVVFGLSIPVLLVSHRLKIPPIVGFLLTGVLAGPSILGLVTSEYEIQKLAEIGVALLLFTIGAEFSLGSLLQIRRLVLIGGSVQLTLTLGAVVAIALIFGSSLNQALCLGFLVSFSSTAIVLKTLQERAEIDSLYGRTTFAVLLFQDVAVVPVMLLIPLLGTVQATSEHSAGYFIGKGVLILILTLGTASWIIPRLLHAIARTRNRELFLVSVVVICFTVAFLTHSAGLSLALGALLAGLIISESDYAHDALTNILPFQQMFTTLFFVSVGMLLDSNFAIAHIWLVLALAAGVVVLKAILAIPSGLVLGFSARTGILCGLALAQVGEFSFVLAETGLAHHVLTNEVYQTFLAVSIVTILVTPLLFAFSHRISSAVLRLPWPERFRKGTSLTPDITDLHGHPPLEDHLIIVGMGHNGKIVASLAETLKIPFVGIELNPDTVRTERAAGRQVVYGDATQAAVLKEEGVEKAKAIVIGTSDQLATELTVSLAKKLNPSIAIIARAGRLEQARRLYALGARMAISQELEAALESAHTMLRLFGIGEHDAQALIATMRERASTTRPFGEKPSYDDLLGR